MASYKQIKQIIAEALKAKKQTNYAEISEQSSLLSPSSGRKNNIFQDYLLAYYQAQSQEALIQPVNNIDDNACEAFQPLQNIIEKAAARVFLEALQEAEIFRQSENNFWEFLEYSGWVAGFFASTAALTYFAPTAAAGTVAVLAGAIPFVLFVILALIICFLAGNTSSSNEIGELAKSLFTAGIYIGISTFPYALAAMPIIAIGSAGLAALGIVLMVAAGIGVAVQRHQANELFSTIMRDKLIVSLHQTPVNQQSSEELLLPPPPPPYKALEYSQECRDRGFEPAF